MRASLLVLALGCGGAATNRPAIEPAAPRACGLAPMPKARAVYETYDQHSTSWGRDHLYPPPARLGTCHVGHGKIVEADGSLVAEITCGLRVVKAGIVDEEGLTVGARGEAVIALRKAAGFPARCVANGPAQVRCHLYRQDESESFRDEYVVAGSLGDRDVIVDEEALAFLRSRVILEFFVNNWCH